MATVVNVNKEKYDVYIGRGTIWGNPYVLGVHGDRAEVISKYRQHLWRQIQIGDITLAQLVALDGLKLGCHCYPMSCHGDVIVSAINWAKSKPIL